MSETRDCIAHRINDATAIGDYVLGVGAGHQRDHEIPAAYRTETSHDAKLRADTERRTDTEMDIQHGSSRLDGYGRMYSCQRDGRILFREE